MVTQWLAIERGVRLITGFLSVIVVSSRITLEEFGTLSLSLFSYALLVSIILMGYEGLLLRRLSGKSKKSHTLNSVITMQFLLAIFLTPPFFLMLTNFSAEQHTLPALALALALLVSPLGSYLQLLYCDGRFKEVATVGVLVALGSLLIRLFPLSGLRSSLNYYAITYATEFFSLSLAYYLVGRRAGSAPSSGFYRLMDFRVIKRFKAYAQYSFSVWAGGVAHQFLGRADQLVVAALLDMGAVGVLAVATKFVEGAVALVNSITPVWQKVIFHSRYDKDLFDTELKKIIFSALIAMLSAYFLPILGLFSVSFFYANEPNFVSAKEIIWYQSLIIPGVVIGMVNGVLMFAVKNHNTALPRVLLALLVQILGLFLLIPYWGLNAVGLIGFASYLASSIGYNFCSEGGRYINNLVLKNIVWR